MRRRGGSRESDRPPPASVRSRPARHGCPTSCPRARRCRRLPWFFRTRHCRTSPRRRWRTPPHRQAAFPRDPGRDTSCSLPCTRRSEEHTSELQSRTLISYAVFCLKKKKKKKQLRIIPTNIKKKKKNKQ